MDAFSLMDISGDAGIKACGKTLKEAFANAAAGMYSLMTDTCGIEELREIYIEVESPSLEGLLVAWLNELIFHFDAYGFAGKKIDIRTIQDNRLTAVLSGENFDAVRHEKRLLIKAATYHKLAIEQKNGLWEINVIFDI